MLKYHCHFKIWNLRYKLSSHSKKIVNYFRRIYSLSSVYKYRVESIPVKSISLSHGNKMPIEDIIKCVNLEIYSTLMGYFSERIIFMHASAVECKENYLLFIGKSDSGKSTMAAMLRDSGCGVLNDDFTPIDHESLQVLSFPMFSNIRKETSSNLQKRHFNLLCSYFKRFNIIKREHVIGMTDREFSEYFSYNKELYDLSGHFKKFVPRDKKLIGIFLKRSDNGISKLRRARFPLSFNIFIDALCMPQNVTKKNFKSVVSVFGNMDFYILESNSVKKSLDLIKGNFLAKKP